MYQCLLAECEGPTAVILGHHQDDVDENRLETGRAVLDEKSVDFLPPQIDKRFRTLGKGGSSSPKLSEDLGCFFDWSLQRMPFRDFIPC